MIRSLPLLSLVLGVACKDKGGGEEIVPVDADGDGFYSVETGGDDCDDGDPAIHPDAVETCDGVDNNCNGDLDGDDGGVVGTTSWFVDRDDDGYGTPDQVSSGCDQPEGTVDNGEDCDDNDDDIHPGATEWCDEVDNDCDGETDEDASGAPTWYADADLDGYGDPDSATRDCAAPSGHVADATDCDDGDAAIYPSAPETCADGVDSDCDGWDGPDTVEADTVADCAQARGTADAAQAAGAALFLLRDADGDGTFGDVVVGGADRAWLLSGAGSEDFALEGTASVDLAGASGSGLGGAVAGILDSTGGSEDAVLFGGPGDATVATDSGAAWLVPAPLRGSVDPAADASLLLLGSDFDHRGGAAVANGGNVDGSGGSWLLVGATGVTDLTRRGGAVYLVSGNLTGTLELADAAEDGGAVFHGDANSYDIGASLIGDLDLDGDGNVDALTGSPGDDFSGTDAGAVYALLGPVADGAWDGNHRLRGASEGDRAGHALAAAGDVDGDGYDDAWIGAPYDDDLAQGGGAALLLRGPVTAAGSLDDLAAARLYGPETGDNAGTSVAGAGDVDGDGTPDVLIGGPREAGNPGPGTAWLVLGPFSGAFDLGDADARITGRSDGDRFGASVLLQEDQDGDGLDELLIGADQDATGGAGAGGVYLFYGAEL